MTEFNRDVVTHDMREATSLIGNAIYCANRQVHLDQSTHWRPIQEGLSRLVDVVSRIEALPDTVTLDPTSLFAELAAYKVLEKELRTQLNQTQDERDEWRDIAKDFVNDAGINARLFERIVNRAERKGVFGG